MLWRTSGDATRTILYSHDSAAWTTPWRGIWRREGRGKEANCVGNEVLGRLPYLLDIQWTDKKCAGTSTPYQPHDSLQEFNKNLIGAVWDKVWGYRSGDETSLACANKLHESPHRIVFTHGDLAHHNILVEDGHVTGFIDWEAAGWYPNYWEFTTAWRYQRHGCYWWQFIHDLGGKNFLEEFEGESAGAVDEHIVRILVVFMVPASIPVCSGRYDIGPTM